MTPTSMYSLPTPILTSSCLSKLSASLSSPTVGGGDGGGWPLRGVGKGYLGVQWLREREARQAGRERGRGRQPASRLYIPAVLIHHVTAPVDSQPRKRGREGRGGLGEGSGTPIVLGSSGASLVDCGGMYQLAHPPKRGALCPPPFFELWPSS